MPMSSRLPAVFYSAAQTRELDARLIASGIPGFELMQRAAAAVWEAVLQRWPGVGRLTVLCGTGNNAGDGYLVGVLAQRAGWQVTVYWLGAPEQLRGDAALAWQAARNEGLAIAPWNGEAELAGVVVDALLGTGLSGPVRPQYAELIEQLNRSALPVVAVDIPSGLDADTGVPQGVAVRAELTVTFIALKPGLLTAQGPDHVGRLVFAALARLPEDVPQALGVRLRLGDWRDRLPARPRAAHKGLFGHVLLVGGERGMGGAIILAAQTALRSGAGRVSVVTRPEHVAALLSRCPEVMVHGLDDPLAMAPLLEQANCLVIGPGLGRSDWACSLWRQILASELPKVLDADALNLLAEAEAPALVGPCLLTPHPAEAARLLGLDTAAVQADRLTAVLRLAERYTSAVVLKGVGSLIAGPPGGERPLALCSDGNPGMAVAGMGDVLSGLAGALLAQSLDVGDAGRYAVLVHALAGDQAAQAGQRGVLASDLIEPIRQLLN